MTADLPSGWNRLTVSQVIDDFKAGFASGEKDVPGGLIHLRMNNIGMNGNLVLDLVRTVPRALGKPEHDLKSGDVLVCTTNSAILVGKCAYFNLEGRYVFSNHLTRLRPNSKVIDGKFLAWQLWMMWKSGMYDDKCKHWVNQSAIPKGALLDASLVVAPIAEQRRIVAKLEKLLEKVEACQKRLDKIPTLLKRFRQSILSAACSGRLTADWRQRFFPQLAGNSDNFPESWTATTLGQIGKWSTGGTPPRHKTEFFGVGVPWVKSGDLKDGPIVKADESITKKGLENSNAKLMPKGTISLALYGATIGRVGLMTFPAATNQACANVVPDNSIVLTTYLFFLLLSHRQQFIEMGQGGAQPNISQGIIRSYAIHLPPLSEQTEILNRIEKIFCVADQIETRYKKAKAHVDKLTQSILAKAFRGELVPRESSHGRTGERGKMVSGVPRGKRRQEELAMKKGKD